MEDKKVLMCHFCNTEAAITKIIKWQKINLCWICYGAFSGVELEEGMVGPKKS